MNVRVVHKILILLCLIFCIFTLAAKNILEIDDSLTSRHVGPYISYFEDVDQTYTIEKLLSDRDRLAFTESTQDVVLIGFSSSAWWAEFTLKNNTEKQTEFYIEYTEPLVDDVRLYVPDNNGKYQLIQSGEHTSKNSQKIDYKNPVFRIFLKPGEQKRYYMRFAGDSGLQFSIKVWDVLSFFKASQREYLFIGMFILLIVTLAMYNLTIYLSSRDVAFLYYVLFIVFYGLLQLGFIGIPLQYILREHGSWNGIMYLECGLLGSVLLNEFLRHFLKIEKHMIQAKVLTFFDSISLIAAIFGFILPYSFMVRFTAIYTLIVTINIYIITLSLYRRKFAFLFLFSFSIHFSGLIIFVLNRLGVIHSYFFIGYIQLVAAAFHTIILAVGLTFYLRNIKREQDKLQREVNDQLESLNRDLVDANIRLENLDKTKSEFLSLISHEVRTPLNGIINIIDELEDMIQTDEQREFIGYLKDSAQRLSYFSELALLITNIRTEKSVVHFSRFNVGELINRAISKAKTNQSCHVCNIIHKTEPENLEMFADVSLIEQTLVSIVENAIIYTASGCTIEISAIKEASQLVITVEDNGEGFPEEMVYSSISPFSHDNQGSYREGFGLSLYAAKLVMEAHDGEMKIGNRENEAGAFVKLYFNSQ